VWHRLPKCLWCFVCDVLRVIYVVYIILSTEHVRHVSFDGSVGCINLYAVVRKLKGFEFYYKLM
jgi:hypothetical protein